MIAAAFKKLFGRKEVPAGVAETTPAAVEAPRPVLEDLPEAVRVETEKVNAYCDRLDAEARRTGNGRLAQQVDAIRRRINS